VTAPAKPVPEEASSLAPVEPPAGAALLPSQEETVAGLLRLAVERGLSPEGLERLVALSERVDDRRAERQLSNALRAFQTECASIEKSKHVSVATRAGGEYGYDYAPLDVIREAIQPLLDRNGFGVSFDSDLDDKGRLVCVCWLHHEGGGKRSARFVCPVDGSPTMSGPQKAAGTLTFAKRQALVAVLGLTMTDKDDDGANPDAPSPPVSEDQAANIRTMLDELGKRVDRARFLAWLRVAPGGTIADIRASDYAKAVKMLERKREAS